MAKFGKVPIPAPTNQTGGGTDGRRVCLVVDRVNACGTMTGMSHPPYRIHQPAEGYRLVVVQDQPQDCPYLPGRTARMPLEMPLGSVSPVFTDWMLARGYRRSGNFLYRTRCPACQECQPTRLATAKFQWSKSFRRVLRRGDRELHHDWRSPVADDARVGLFNRHRLGRSLDVRDTPIDGESYESFLINHFGEAEELAIFFGHRLVAVAIVDIGQDSLSAVYTMFDPEFSRYSLGTYAILKQIERAGRTGRRYVYLGMYVRENRHLNYKARFAPQERLIDGTWQTIDDFAARE